MLVAAVEELEDTQVKGGMGSVTGGGGEGLT